MKIIEWTEPALKDYHDNIDYLLRYWSEKEASNFITDVDHVLFDLKSGVVKFKPSDYKNVKACVICKQITLFYRDIDNSKIELLRFWNNYQDDRNLKL